jgi:hypothetical protein
MLLKQARKGFSGLIDENRQSMYILDSADSSNPWAKKDKLSFSGRISHESSRQAPNLNPSPAGLSTNLQRFLSVEYTVNFLKKGDIIIDKNDKQWKLGPVDPLEKFGGIHGYQAPLEDAS